MRTNLVRMAVLLAAATMAAPAFAGKAEPAGVDTPDPNDWQYREAMETGNLPATAIASGPAENVPTVEYGGKIYRVAIDTP